ncbi:MAG: response regulator [Gammaproteobacteria bacterium]|nr:response regulator [Gammaproteobacteria bacterium]
MDDTERGDALAELEFQKAIFDGLAAHIAVVDSHGTILSVNAAWQAFGEANGLRDKQFGVGVNYFSVCRAAVDPDARAALKGIKQVLSAARPSFYLEYPCHSPDEQRWFALRATPLIGYPSLVVVAHENITERVITDNRLEAQLRASAVTTAGDTSTSKQLVLLVVDDNAALLKVTADFLARMNVQVHTAADGIKAIELLDSGVKPDCILTDYHMPGMNGIDLIRHAREQVDDIACIIMSGDPSGEIISAANLSHCALIQKPFELRDLFTLINQTTGSSS